jgi:hypothetical protein
VAKSSNSVASEVSFHIFRPLRRRQCLYYRFVSNWLHNGKVYGKDATGAGLCDRRAQDPFGLIPAFQQGQGRWRGQAHQPGDDGKGGPEGEEDRPEACGARRAEQGERAGYFRRRLRQEDEAPGLTRGAHPAISAVSGPELPGFRNNKGKKSWAYSHCWVASFQTGSATPPSGLACMASTRALFSRYLAACLIFCTSWK